MRYKRLRIANYRGVDSSEIECDSRGLTLVQGPNEVGKTSLGEAISILFEYPDSSKHSAVVAIRPVHRDAGPEIELEAESGPYAFTYTKRFHKKPETKLTVTAPKPENHTGREAHDRAKEILTETLDVNLWTALTIQQGDAIDQPDLAKQQSLSAALDKAAGGIPTDQAEEGVFEKVTDEYGRFYTAKGQEKAELKQAREQQEKADAKVAQIEGALHSLDQDTDSAARLQTELKQLTKQEAELTKQLKEQETVLEEIATLESRVSEATLKLESATTSLELAQKNQKERQDLVEAVNDAKKQHAELLESSKESSATLERAEKEFKTAETAFNEADGKRKDADRIADLRRADFDYYNNLLHLQQLGERKERIDTARKNAAVAEETILNNKVNKQALETIEQGERELLTVTAKLETGSPSVTLRGLAPCDIRIDDDEAAIESEEVRTLAVPDRLRISIPERVDIEVTAGSSTDQLTRQVADAREGLDAACRAAGVSNPDSARKAYEARQEASRKIEEKERIEQENLRDLTYDDLADKVVRLNETVPEYLADRTSEPAIAADLGAARTAWEQADLVKQDCHVEWETARQSLDTARGVRDKFSKKHSEVQMELRRLEKNLQQQQSHLDNARNAASDDSFEAAVKAAEQSVTDEGETVRTAEAQLKEKNPDQVKALAETAKSSLSSKQRRREAANTELTEVQTRLKIHGEEGLHEQLHAAKTAVESATANNRSLSRNAAAAKLLYDIMRQERDKARQAYVAPLKERIERLGRLVFDESFQVEIGDDLRIVSRTNDNITVPFNDLSGGTKEQLSLIFRLACSMIVAEEGGMPLIMDDALGYSDPDRLQLMGAVLAKAAKECQIVIFTCYPDRYANIGDAAIVSL
ncbi:MAG: hypothetical protein DWQ35_21735 [Planctomycetota bacterium]|nr:MAG: hypothetical protein DWQ35_21735 [Planctomycetota bacterium]REK31624.1 MAG: hypothetical protein DWQ42_00040 [Planctomycetota bacterium]REK42374.1 MAG: hypothetical protein DWQ46_13610 [Planctomycetota bacterium]